MIRLCRNDLSVAGLVPTDITNWLAGGGGTRAPGGIAGRVGSVIGPKLAAPPRYCEIGVLAKLTAMTDRPAIVQRADAWTTGLLLLETDDRPGVQTWVVRDGPIQWLEAAPGAPKFAVPSMSGRLSLLAVDGGSEDVEPTQYVLGTTPTEIPTGSLPCGGTITTWGYTAPLWVTYTPANGNGATVLVVAQVLGSGESVVLDLDRDEAYWCKADGTRVEINTSGIWPTLDAADAIGDALIAGTGTAAYGTLAVSSGTALWQGRRRYRL